MTDPVQFYDLYVKYCTNQWNYRKALEAIDFCQLTVKENNNQIWWLEKKNLSQEALLKSSILSLPMVLQLSSNYCNIEICDETF